MGLRSQDPPPFLLSFVGTSFQVESGSPLVTLKDGVWWLIGESIWAERCTEHNTGVHGNISYFQAWIRQQMKVNVAQVTHQQAQTQQSDVKSFIELTGQRQRLWSGMLIFVFSIYRSIKTTEIKIKDKKKKKNHLLI